MSTLHFLKSGLAAKWLTACFMLIFSVCSEASHFRGGSITWQALELDNDGLYNDVQFTVKTAWRYNAVNSVGLSISPALSTTDISEDRLYVNGNISGADYALQTSIIEARDLDPAVPYQVSFASCCRISGLQNNAGGSWDIQTTVLMSEGNLAPKLDLPIIFEVPQFQSDGVTTLTNWTFDLNTTDPNADKVRYRVATEAELGGGGSANPTGFNLDANTGLITWVGSGSMPSGLYSAGIVVEDLDIYGNVKSKSHVDFIIDLQPKAATAFTPSGNIPTSRNVIVEKGTTFSFSVTGVAIETTSLGDIQGALTEPTEGNFVFDPGIIGAGLNPGTYPIAFEVRDTNDTDATNYLLLNFIVPDPLAPKIVNLDGDSVTYTTTTGILVDQTVNALVTDVDDTDLNGGALRYNVTFTDGELEVLGIESVGDGAGEIRVTGYNVYYEGNLIGVIDGYQDGQGRALVVNFTTPDATIAAVQALVRSLTYTDDFILRAPTIRALSLSLEDPDGRTSAYNFSADVQDHPSKPAPGTGPLISSNELALEQGATVVLDSSNLNAADPDVADTITFNVSNVTHGQFEYSGASGVAITSFTQTELNFGQVRFVHDNTGDAPSYDVSATDGTTPTAPAPATIRFFGITPVSASVDENSTTVATISITSVTAPATFSITDGADMSLFTINSGGVLSFASAPDYESPADSGGDNVYNLEVSVFGVGGTKNIQLLTVTVQDINDNTPVITSDGGDTTADIPVDENTTAVTTATATDADASTTLSYSISGTDAAAFSINSSTGVLTFSSAPDFDAPTDSDTNNTYVVIVTVSDGTNTDTQTITVTVQNLNDSTPVITSNSGGATAALNVDENTTAVTTVTAVDEDAGASLSYSISGGTDSGAFSINSSTGVLTFSSAPDFEAPADNGTNNTYVVIVTVSDGTNTDTQTITVTVQNLNDNTPVITSNSGGATAAISIDENTTAVTTATATDADSGATLSYSISGTDAAAFSINSSSGVLTFGSAPDFDAPTDSDTNNTYVVIVTVSDGTNTDTQTITVTVQNLNDNTPVITSNSGGATAAISIDENTTAVTTATATDADTGATLSYSISGTDAAAFSINSSTGVLAFSSAPDFEVPTDSDTNNTYVVIVTVSDGTNTDTQTITVTVQNLNDNTPVITSNSGGATAAISIDENTTAVTTGTATDADTGATLSYSISGTDAAAFSINSSTGVLVFSSAPDFEVPTDSDTNNTYVVIVTVSDGTNTDTQTITVTVQNLNDNTPTITSNSGGATAAVNVDENTTAVTTVVATDVDAGATQTYSISGGVDSGAFSINSSTGVLTFNSAPDFEVPTDSDTNNTYVVIVTVSDGTNTDTQTITVAVQNLNDNNPIITSNAGGDTATVSVNENVSAVTTVTATDADTGATLSYSLSGTDASAFTIDGTSGALTFTAAPDYDAPLDEGGDNSYAINVIASDGTHTDLQALTVLVLRDTDDDGQQDNVDSDDDNDGIPDSEEGDADTDNDGIPDARDPDSDNDGIPDSDEGTTDSDDDGIPDYRDNDSDNDGESDSDEGDADSDNDGIKDYLDTSIDEDSDGIPDILENNTDSDNDGIPDNRDPDSDNDGLPDVFEASMSGNDTDEDGIDDSVDVDQTEGTDTNGDGIDDNAALADLDEDGIPDLLDPDSDGDSVPDSMEAASTGLDTDEDGIDDRIDVDQTEGTDANGDGVDDNVLTDVDGDGLIDVHDIDSDNDGIDDNAESNGLALDTDDDGIDDRFDVDQTGGDDSNLDGVDDTAARPDTDEDGVIDVWDLDSDNDGLADVVEAGLTDIDQNALADVDSIITNTPVDSDDDGIADFRDLDSDNDGVWDIEGTPAQTADTNNDGRIDNPADLDGDGIADVIDEQPDQRGSTTDGDGDTVPGGLDRDDDGDGIPDSAEGSDDSDNDGVVDSYDGDSDNDGIPDTVEADLPAAMGVDTDLDGIDDAYDADATGGVDANSDGVDDALTARDTDNDGTPDYQDTDSDNDGLPDIYEMGLASLTGNDTDSDGIDDAFDVDATSGVDANGDGIDDALLVITDTDLDGLANYLDPDSDNDNMDDELEDGDFNNDGINDRLQKQANVETAVKGAGSMNLGLVLGLAVLLLGSFLVRLRQSKVLLVGLLLSSASAWSACSLEDGLNLKQAECWYAGAGIGLSFIEPETSGTGWDVSKDRATALQLHTGFMLNDHWLVETAYADLSRAIIRHNNPAWGAGDVNYDVFSLVGGYQILPSTAELNVVLKAGYASLITDSTHNVGMDKINSNGLVLGVAAQWRISETVIGRIVLDSYDQDAAMLGVTLSRRF